VLAARYRWRLFSSLVMSIQAFKHGTTTSGIVFGAIATGCSALCYRTYIFMRRVCGPNSMALMRMSPEAIRRLVEAGAEGEEMIDESAASRGWMRQRTLCFAVVVALVLANVGSKADDLLSQLRKRYEDCFHRAVRLRGVSPTSNAIELAFQACQSDERAIVQRLSAVGMAPATADKALQAFKLRLQKSVRYKGR
jgi:hypothetical protein